MTVGHPVIETSVSAPDRRPGAGLVAALGSALAFGTSGSFAQSLFAQGWTPGAVVSCRLALAALLLAIPAVRALRGRWWILRVHALTLLAYGLIAVAGCQLFFYSGVQRLSVSMALLLEYTSPLLIVLGTWIATRRLPRRLTLIGGVIALAGLVLVLDLFGNLRLDALGLLFSFGAAVCNAGYFVISARRHDDLPPMVLAAGGLFVGAIVLGLAGAAGMLELRGTLRPVTLLEVSLPWWLPILGVSLVAAALAYVLGIVGTRALGPTVAAFVGLSEVVFAVLWAWFLIGERPLPQQLLGGVVILVGVVIIKADDLRAEADDRGGPSARISQATPVA